MELVDRMLAGDQRALARLMTLVENRSPEVPEIVRLINHRLGHAYRVGVTGPPGAGKSTLVDRLTALIRGKGQTVGIVAIDPTSPFSGGALLGDRIRMQQHYLDGGVFIRSMGTRGSHGGLARATKDVVKLIDAAGKDWALVETVGVGQTELDVMEATDTTIVVLVPESGDAIQTMKAGLLEIADIFVVNKADRSGAERVVAELQMMVQLAKRQDGWQIPVLTAQAENNVGIAEILQSVESHRAMLHSGEEMARRRGQCRRFELIEIVEERIRHELDKELRKDGVLGKLADKVMAGDVDPYTAAEQIIGNNAVLTKLAGKQSSK